MANLLITYANMLEASVRTPERFPGRRPSRNEKDRRLRVVALLRALSQHEALALLRDKKLPDRLENVARAVGLTLKDSERALTGIVWQLTEGLRASNNPREKQAPADSTEGSTSSRGKPALQRRRARMHRTKCCS